MAAIRRRGEAFYIFSVQKPSLNTGQALLISRFDPVTLADEARLSDSPALIDENGKQKAEVAQQVEETWNFRGNLPIRLFLNAHEAA